MTKVITRYFATVAQARAVKDELVYRRRASIRIIRLFETADGLADTLTKANVAPDTAKAYQDRMSDGGAVLMVRAGHKPLAIAKTTRIVTAEMGAVPFPDLSEETEVRDAHDPKLSVLEDQPLMLSRMRDPSATNHYMANWPFPLIKRRKPFSEMLFPPHARMASWPIGLLVPGRVRYGRFPFGLLVPGQKFMAKFPFAHIVPGHKHMAKFPFAHIVPGHKHMAKFPFGHLVPGHARMANWPFPLLINGEKHTNSLVPGHRYMGKFPFGHIVPGHKFMAKFPFAHIVPGHRHMAKFPFAHIVPGHRFMAKFPFAHIVPGHKHMANFPFGHIVPGHKFMANWIFPHTKDKAA